MSKKIKVIIKKVDQPFEIKEVDDDYKSMQRIVDGYIEYTPLDRGENIDIICNDEYLINGSKANFIRPERGDVIGGDVLFVGVNEDGETLSLTDEQIEAVKEYLQENEVHNMSIAEAKVFMEQRKVALLKKKPLSEMD